MTPNNLLSWERLSVAAILVLVVSVPRSLGIDSRPNVLVILADDQGWGDLSLHGNANLSTPQIDGLARSGAAFERFYVQPVCSPTRAEFLTGRYAPRGGVTGVTSGDERLDPNVATIADAFHQAGYATAAFGKWHNGTQAPYHPISRGFGQFYGFCSGHWGLYFNPMLEENGRIVRGQDYITDDFTHRAIEFIQRHREQPFFAYLAYNTPHSPMQVPDRWWEAHDGQQLEHRGTRSASENLDHTRAALAMCENIDWNVGRLLDSLDELGLRDNTIVLYFSDNGPNGHRWNGGMRGVKGSTDEGGVRVPLLISWPSHIRAGKWIKPAAAAIDLGPTLAELAGISLVGQLPIDGRSLQPLLLGDEADWPERTLFTHWGGRVSARRGAFVLDAKERLYNLSTDPGQTDDISAERPDVAKRLSAAVADWRREVLPSAPPSARPFVIGHPDLLFTHLPARDAEAHGHIQRSSPHPNCSYFTNWTRTDERIVWPVEIASAGTYRAEVYYTCSDADTGALVELRLDDQSVQSRVTPAHDPPLVSSLHNRCPGSESPVKDFRPLNLGEIHLPKTTGKLILQALEIPGAQVMDFRLLVLTRLNQPGSNQ